VDILVAVEKTGKNCSIRELEWRWATDHEGGGHKMRHSTCCYEKRGEGDREECIWIRKWRKMWEKSKDILCFFLTEHYALKVYWGSGAIAPLIL